MRTKRQYESWSFPRRADHTENNAHRHAEKEIISRNHVRVSRGDPGADNATPQIS